MHIGLFTPLLLSPSPGGAEKATYELAQGLRDLGHQVTLFYSHKFDLSKEKPFWKPGVGVQCQHLSFRGDTRSVAMAVETLRQPGLDVLCAFVWDKRGLSAQILSGYAGIPFIYVERSAPDMVVNVFWNAMNHARCADEATAIVVQMESYRQWYPAQLRSKIVVIPNSVQQTLKPADPGNEDDGPKLLLAVGKMHDNLKNFSALLCAFALLLPEFPHWKCCFCGDGKDLENYRSMAERLGIQHAVLFRGRVEQMEQEYAAAHIFCIPSLSEGFPNVLGEAQTHGLPSVGFAVCSGVNELIVSGENGFLAQESTEAALARSLRPLMKSAKLRRLLGARAREDSTRFSPDRVHALWETLFQKVKEKRF